MALKERSNRRKKTLPRLVMANGYVAEMALNKLQSVLPAIKIPVAPS